MPKYLLTATCMTVILPVALMGCTSKKLVNTPQYWQRNHASESAYLNGPKAQQILNRDIARCVTELKELERLDQIKDAIPVDSQGRVLDPDELQMYRADNPNRDGALLSEQLDYQDFEGCMQYKGWERTEFVPYNGVLRAEDNYYENHIDTRTLRFKGAQDDHKVIDGSAQTVDQNTEYND